MGGEKKGNKKHRKSDQPKRQRYNSAKRGYRRRVRDLERHIQQHPNDTAAEGSLLDVRRKLGA